MIITVTTAQRMRSLSTAYGRRPVFRSVAFRGASRRVWLVGRGRNGALSHSLWRRDKGVLLY